MIRKQVLIVLLAVLTAVGVQGQVSKMESEYLRLSQRFEYRDKDLLRDLKLYLRTYPYTTYEDEVHFMQGALQVERGYYKQGLRELEVTTFDALGRSHQPQYRFYRGYAYLMQQDYERASIYFGILAKGTSEYRVKGSYYFAYCQYKLTNYDKALPILLELEDNPTYRATVPYYIVQIYYAQKQYDQVTERVERLLTEQPESPNNGELHRILGEMYFHEGRYTEAIEQLKQYEESFTKQKIELVRNDLYLLGMAQYKTEDYQGAVNTLKRVKQQRDTISESVCMTMANAYVKLGQVEQAKLNYRAAMDFGLTPSVREEATYNYALTSYQASTALGESVKAFTDFLHKYPKSKHATDIYRLMSDAFMQSKNYASALQALDSVPDNNAQLRSTKQYLRYQLGTDAFVQGKMADAKQWMTDVIEHAESGDRYATDAYYWRAEAEYRLREYDKSVEDLNTFYSRPDARRSPNHIAAAYLTGYTRFSLRDYPNASTAFQRYVDATPSSEPTHADALNRIGDCYFNARDFNRAVTYYGQVISLNATGSDYATFQRGYALGLMRRYDEKINNLRQLVARYPKSDYADDGLYEIARAELQLDHEHNALNAYEQLLKNYPNSNMARKASIERAMLYRSLHNNEKAIEAYKQTISRYPASEEAYTALDGLEAIYVETNNINEYIQYTKQLGRLNMSITTKEDSLSYVAAELQYMNGSYAQAVNALNGYLSKYCTGGRYCTTALYYAADSYYRLGQNEDALREFRTLTTVSGNPYMEEACTRVAELSYDKGDYNTALEYFYKMLEQASTREQTDVARLGILRCSYYLERTQATIDIAGQILADEPVADDVKAEALYNRGRAYVASQQYGLAIVDLTPIAQDVRTATGAEAKYLLALCYYNLGALDNAEAEIMSFAQMNTTQQYWLAKALILLADINVDRGEDFQAQQYLLTLRTNYTRQDDILDIVNQRLAAINERQQEKVED